MDNTDTDLNFDDNGTIGVPYVAVSEPQSATVLALHDQVSGAERLSVLEDLKRASRRVEALEEQAVKDHKAGKSWKLP